jgi:hypothetical protein
VKRICNLEQKKGLNYKSGGLRFELEFLFEIQGPRCKVEAKI